MSSAQRIETTHVGSLPRTPELQAANQQRQQHPDDFTLEAGSEYDALVADAVRDVVHRQKEAGITQVNDGEFGKAMSAAVDFGAWWSYSFQRTGGLSIVEATPEPPVRSTPGHPQLTTFADRRDWTEFRDVYTDPEWFVMPRTTTVTSAVTTGPLTYRGYDAVAADTRHLVDALTAEGLDVSSGFITALAPGSAARIGNKFYATEEEHLFAWAEVLREEYRAILDAGLTLQVDDPSIAESWDQINPEPTVADYRTFLQPRIDALNSALEGLPTDRIRFHLCWGSWHGPHTTDIEMRHIVDLMLQINAGQYSFEAGNARHEHEWKVWRDVELPAGKKILPGVVSHATNVVEHPELVADRIERFASVVGPENVVASTDCGLGGRVHPHIAQAKLATLGEGARIASERLFG